MIAEHSTQCTYSFRWCSLTDLPQVGVHARQAATTTGSLRFPGSLSMSFILNHSQERTSEKCTSKGKCLKALFIKCHFVWCADANSTAEGGRLHIFPLFR